MIYHRQTIYSLQALGFLAIQPTYKFVNVRELAHELKIPRHFLGKVLTDLVKKGLLLSIKGPSGGFRLAVDANSMSINEIMTIFGEQDRFENSCIMGQSRCNDNSPCPLHFLWQEFIERAISKTQVLTLAEYSQNMRNELSNSVSKPTQPGVHS